MEYTMMIPPFEIEEFSSLNKQKVKQYFEWFCNQIPFRLSLLNQAFVLDNGTNLDYSKKSLIYLWRWFMTDVFEITKKEKKEIQAEKKNFPTWMHEDIEKDKWKPTTESLTIAMDIGIYVSEVIRLHNSSLSWGVVSKPKSLEHVNKPVIIGFSSPVEFSFPRIMSTLIEKLKDGEKDEKELIQLIETWQTFV